MFKRSAQTKLSPGPVTKILTSSPRSRSPSWNENHDQGKGSQQVDGAAELTPVTMEKGVSNVGEGGLADNPARVCCSPRSPRILPLSPKSSLIHAWTVMSQSEPDFSDKCLHPSQNVSSVRTEIFVCSVHSLTFSIQNNAWHHDELKQLVRQLMKLKSPFYAFLEMERGQDGSWG